MIFLTGGTGFLGAELLSRMILSPDADKIAVLIRGTESETRFKRLIAKLPDPNDALSRVELVKGDTSLNNFGLGDAEFKTLASKVSTVFHCAASTNLGQSLEAARANNVAGTQNALALAQESKSAGNLKNFFHVSTAFVAGDVTETVCASRLNTAGPFKNSYEQSKAEAEVLVQSSGLDYCIFRPSVIVGDSLTGVTTSFNVLYIPVKLLVHGLFSALPLSTNAPFDMVPVNYVADSMTSLAGFSVMTKGGILVPAAQRNSSVYHLAAGVGRESNPLEVMEQVIEAFNKSKLARFSSLHIPATLPQDMLHLIHHSICVARTGVKSLEKLFTKNLPILSQILPFLPYMIRNPQFDCEETEADLDGIIGPAPLFLSYAERLFLYCFESDWGRKPVPV